MATIKLLYFFVLMLTYTIGKYISFLCFLIETLKVKSFCIIYDLNESYSILNDNLNLLISNFVLIACEKYRYFNLYSKLKY